jgi:hypothetical protein
VHIFKNLLCAVLENETDQIKKQAIPGAKLPVFKASATFKELVNGKKEEIIK